MREILFRGKPKNEADYYLFSRTHKDNCKDGFVYGSLVISGERYFICVSALCSANSLVNNGITTMIEVIPETIGQYTGLTDKNGKKIFEGDIVKAQDDVFGSPFCYGIVGKIVYDECAFFIEPSNPMDSQWLYDECAVYEVIGNIHDTPELLEGE